MCPVGYWPLCNPPASAHTSAALALTWCWPNALRQAELMLFCGSSHQCGGMECVWCHTCCGAAEPLLRHAVAAATAGVRFWKKKKKKKIGNCVEMFFIWSVIVTSTPLIYRKNSVFPEEAACKYTNVTHYCPQLSRFTIFNNNANFKPFNVANLL